MNRISATLAALALTALLAMSGQAVAETVQIQVGGDISGGVNQHIINNWLPKLEEMTDGEVELELVSGGSIVPHSETLDAIDQGLLGGDFVLPSYFAGIDPAFSIMGDLVAGYDTPLQMMQLCYHGGGREMLQKIVDTYTDNVVVVGCGSFEREAFVAAVPINGVADLEGLKIRSPEGLAAEIFSRAGAVAVPLPFSEVYTSLDKGVIDAADASNYGVNKDNGFHEVAKYPLFPGIHSMPGSYFTVNRDVYDSLSEGSRVALDVWFQAMSLDLMMWVDQRDRRLVAEDKANAAETGLTIIDWSVADRDALREIAKGAWEDAAKESDLAQEAYDLNINFMRSMGMLE